MNLRFFRRFVLSVLFVAFPLFAQQVHIKIIETTDTHGAIFPYDFTNLKPLKHSLAQIYAYVKEQRKDASQSVLLFSNGDILQGTPVVYYYNFEVPQKPHLYAKVMNFMKYDVGTVGNHDIEPGHDVYDRFRKEIHFPWLAANAVREDNGEPYFQPYQTFNVKGVKIAVLGLITPGIPNWLPKILWSGMFFDDMVNAAKKWVKIIEEKEKPDILIGLFHAGVDLNYGGSSEVYMNENASQAVAEEVPGFDLVFVGHDHHGWNYKVANETTKDSVAILGGTSSARVFGVADFYYNLSRHNLDSLNTELVDSKNYKPDSVFMQTFKPQFDSVKNYVEQPLGTFTKSVDSRNALFGESEFVDLVHFVQLKLTGAQISFAAPLSMHAKIDSGEIIVGDMFKLYHYENYLYTMRLKGSEIKKALEYAAAMWFNQMKSEDDRLLNFEYDKNGKIKYSERYHSPVLKGRFYNFETAAGINYQIDVTKPAGERVEIFSLSDGTPFDTSAFYTVALNSYRGNGGGGHLTKGVGIPKNELSKRLIKSSKRDFRFLMMKWIEKQQTITPPFFGNWKIVPEKWVEKAAKRDYELMFGNEK